MTILVDHSTQSSRTSPRLSAMLEAELRYSALQRRSFQSSLRARSAIMKRSRTETGRARQSPDEVSNMACIGPVETGSSPAPNSPWSTRPDKGR